MGDRIQTQFRQCRSSGIPDHSCALMKQLNNLYKMEQPFLLMFGTSTTMGVSSPMCVQDPVTVKDWCASGICPLPLMMSTILQNTAEEEEHPLPLHHESCRSSPTFLLSLPQDIAMACRYLSQNPGLSSSEVIADLRYRWTKCLTAETVSSGDYQQVAQFSPPVPETIELQVIECQNNSGKSNFPAGDICNFT